jgi:hypothetical protein
VSTDSIEPDPRAMRRCTRGWRLHDPDHLMAPADLIEHRECVPCATAAGDQASADSTAQETQVIQRSKVFSLLQA